MPAGYKGSRILILTLLALGAGGCGGGGGDGGISGGPSSPGGGGSSGTWKAGVFQPSTNFRNRCVAPRAGTSDLTGTVTDQNNWLRSWTNELYLWYSEVPDLDPALYQTANYFDQLKSPSKDRFHFTYPTDVWEALSTQGQEVTYGLTWALTSTTVPRRAYVAYVEPNPPAATANSAIARGAEVLTVDGVDLVNVNTQSGVDTLNAGLFPDNPGESHTFGIREVNGNTRTVNLISANTTSVPVQNVKVVSRPTGPVGYILFNDHIATAEGGLRDAITQLKASAISDLVLDIRYNGGGYLDIASELAYMIAGPTPTAGRTFERLQFNDKYPNTNPVTGQALTPTPFHTTTRGIQPGLGSGQALPTLNLQRVFVLTGANTCSASEAIINGLRGVDVQVIQIGTQTCGKPYGFYDFDNCGTTYFSIQFRGVNAKDYGDYTNGFSPDATGNEAALVKGCPVADDFTHALGDPAEARFSMALGYIQTSSCTAAATAGMMKPQAYEGAEAAVTDVIIPKTPWRENRIMQR